ncbi:hypothetical protein ACFV0R_28295 [Streptomyces sp. NPDC059578]|uniref:hypothetical protein n=1 Tax=unclassified Streptomyces TaxID=2593676 RepID=UPI00366A4651
MSYRIQYSDEARAALRALEKASPDRLRNFQQEMTRIARSPYAFGSPVGGINDRRQAAVAGTVTMYWISQNVLTISVVTIVHTG